VGFGYQNFSICAFVINAFMLYYAYYGVAGSFVSLGFCVGLRGAGPLVCVGGGGGGGSFGGGSWGFLDQGMEVEIDE